MIEEHTYSTDITARFNDKDRPSALAIKNIWRRRVSFPQLLKSFGMFFLQRFLLVSSKLFYRTLNCSQNKLLKKLHKLLVHHDYVVSHGKKNSQQCYQLSQK